MEYKDYYKAMGVARDASADDIKRAYRKLARKYHPDVSTEKNAETQFKEINEAYEVLKDPEKRKAYDQFGSQWQAGQQFNPNDFDFSQFRQAHGNSQFTGAGAGGFSDFFENLFGGGAHFNQRRHRSPRPQKGEDLHTTITITLAEAYQGTSKTINFRVPIQDLTGHRREETKSLSIKIPAGVKHDQQIRLAGQGAQGAHGGANGDLYLKVHLEEHPVFKVKERDIYLDLPIAPWEAALGADVNAPTLGGVVSVKIPVNAKTGQKMRLRGRGLQGKEPGDQYLILQIQTPAANDEAAREAYENMAKQFATFNPRRELEANL